MRIQDKKQRLKSKTKPKPDFQKAGRSPGIETVLKKAKEAEKQNKKHGFYRVPISCGFKDIPKDKFQLREKELKQIATGPIVFINP